MTDDASDRRITRRQFLGTAAATAAVARPPKRRAASTTRVPAPSTTVAPASTSTGVAATTSVPGVVPTGPGTLLLLVLYGGNDGLNTVIPAADPAYQAQRASLAYRPEEVLSLGEGLGLHPAMTSLKSLWDRRQLAIVRGVGYPNPNRSHFRSMDIWQSGSPDTYVPTGWLGRWYDAVGTDPLGMVGIGTALPRSLTGAKTGGVTVPVGNARVASAADLAAGVRSMNQPDAGASLLAARVRATGVDLGRVETVFGPLLASMPEASVSGTSLEVGDARATSDLDAQLGVVSKLIRGGAPTRVYAVSLGGFDTHASQRATHARLLGVVDAAIGRFLGGLAGDPRGAGVTVAVHSEFGRRVQTNGSAGTDHGTAAPVLVAGPAVHGGFYGDQPALTNLDQGDLRATTDFRRVYATLLAGVLGADPATALDGSFPSLGFV